MTQLLLRLFVKDYHKLESPAVRTAVGSLAGITGIVCNALLFVLKLVAGILSGAVSIVADALNNLSDAASSVVTLLGFRLAQRPADADHPYGHARYEYLSGLIVSALIMVIGFELGKSALERVFSPEPILTTGLTLGILVVSVLIKLWMSLFFSRLGKKISSGTLKAAAVDSRNDVIATGAVLAGCVLQSIIPISLDGYIGLGVSGFILWSGIRVARETISPLLGQRADQQLVQKINSLLLSHDKVLGVHDLLVHDYGPGQCFASVHVELSAAEEPLVCHDIIDDMECDALEELNVHLVIHYDPVVENDREQTAMRTTVEEILFELDPSLSFHDFRVVRGAEKPKLVFDLAVPYARKKEHAQIKEAIENALSRRNLSYTTLIHFDDKL